MYRFLDNRSGDFNCPLLRFSQWLSGLILQVWGNHVSAIEVPLTKMGKMIPWIFQI